MMAEEVAFLRPDQHGVMVVDPDGPFVERDEYEAERRKRLIAEEALRFLRAGKADYDADLEAAEQRLIDEGAIEKEYRGQLQRDGDLAGDLREPEYPLSGKA
jgi:hypothetical protein